jgi:tetratricopeptide (TPR) repeat protein
VREPREDDLPWPDEIFDMELEPEIRAELEAVGVVSGTIVKHLLSVQVLAETDPEAAYQHAQRVRQRIPRLALGRQTACIAAYRAGHFREAIKEESAYRRVTNKLDLVPMAADSERGLGRPERALALVAEFEGQKLDSDSRTELYIVAGGAREDLGDLDAARMFLQKAVRAAKSPMATARSRFALGHLLMDTDPDQARKWLQSAAEADPDEIWTDAAELLETM